MQNTLHMAFGKAGSQGTLNVSCSAVVVIGVAL